MMMLFFVLMSMMKAFSSSKMISILISMEITLLSILMLWLILCPLPLYSLIIFFCTMICESSVGLSILIMIINSKNPFSVSFSVICKY